MDDATSLLATISQSSAAMIAIIGGFLVSRLVAISSEREGIKRQLKAADQEQDRLRREWEPIHRYRLENSVRTMEGWLEDDLIDERERTKDLSIEEVLEGRLPRGSSIEEMLPFAEAFKIRVDKAFKAIAGLLSHTDTRSLDLDDLKARGLTIKESDEDLFDSVFYTIRSELPQAYQRGPFGHLIPDMASNLVMSPVRVDGVHEIKMRRLDESIREESQLRSQLDAAEQEVARLTHDLEVFAQPVGVTAAIAILGLFSALGIVLPLGFLAFAPQKLDLWVVILMFVCFVAGICAVLAYIAWYFHKIKA